jgi:uncharacterized hydrophobic protein (TIGR00271 family)
MNKKGFITEITKSDQYVAINDLVLESKESPSYYSLLILSAVIIASGILLANSAILIGGMLVTPVLTPILLISLGITTGRPILIKNTSRLVLKSIAIVFAVSFFAGLIFPIPENKEFFSTALFNDTARSAFLYFLVAFASGIAATFAWVRKKTTNMLPGISIAVSLVPPISLIAIWLSQNELVLSRFFLMVFLFNMIGIIMGSMIVFSMLRFYKSEGHIENIVNNHEKEKAEEEKLKQIAQQDEENNQV